MTYCEFDNTFYLILTTEVDQKSAYKIAKSLLEEKLIPCVTFKNVESHFWWEGKINQSKEVQLLVKCKEEYVNKVCKKILECHSYEVPEIIYFPVSTEKNYHHWLCSI